LGFNDKTLGYRVRRWGAEKALTTPINTKLQSRRHHARSSFCGNALDIEHAAIGTTGN
jgi:hypothetical protein